MYVLPMMLMIVSPLMVLSFNSIILIWSFMELSSISFISFLKMNYLNEETMIYYLTQSVGSLILMYSFMKSETKEMSFKTESMISMFALMLKLGVMPFHNWFIILGKSIKMKNLMILLTIQKSVPLFIISMISVNSIIIFIILMSMIFSLFIQIIIISLKEVVIYSSIFQTSWMMMIIVLNTMMGLVYFIIYSLSLVMVLKEMTSKNSEQINNQSIKFNLIFSINLVSLSGIPPFMGFVPKWLMIKSLLKEPMILMILFLMMLMSVMSFFVYFRMIFFKWMKSKNFYQMTKNYKMTLMIQTLFPLTIFLM